jgi:hypothetical protein
MTVRLGMKTGNAELDRVILEIVTELNRLSQDRVTLSALTKTVTSGSWADAPADGKTYGRLDGSWVEVGSGSGDHLLLEDGPPPVPEFLLLEDGTFLLLESGDRLVMEA